MGQKENRLKEKSKSIAESIPLWAYKEQTQIKIFGSPWEKDTLSRWQIQKLCENWYFPKGNEKNSSEGARSQKSNFDSI